MKNFIASTFLYSAVFLILSKLTVGLDFSGTLALVTAGAVFSLVSLWVKPFLTAITLPLSLLAFSIFVLVVNGVLIILTALFTPGFTVEGLAAVGWAAAAIAAVNFLFSWVRSTLKAF